jgi:Holliday junction resolvase
MNSRSKGARGERDAAAAWVAAVGGCARRGQQFAGGTESPDVVCSQENIHLEVKRTERGNPYTWMEQAVRDAGPKIPVVLHRRNGQEWLLIARLSDASRLSKEIAETVKAVGGGAVSPALPSESVPAAVQQDA